MCQRGAYVIRCPYGPVVPSYPTIVPELLFSLIAKFEYEGKGYAYCKGKPNLMFDKICAFVKPGQNYELFHAASQILLLLIFVTASVLNIVKHFGTNLAGICCETMVLNQEAFVKQE